MGLYPPPPAHLIQYDIDGSQLLRRRASDNYIWFNETALWQRIISPVQQAMHYSSYPGHAQWFYIFFPRPMDITHHLIAYTGSGGPFSQLAWSTDATDYDNGTWTNTGWANSWAAGEVASRTGTDEFNPPLLGARAIRWYTQITRNDSPFHTLRLYGTPSTYDNDELVAWDPTLDSPATPAHFDFGDLYQNDIGGPIAFRVKNTSLLHTAASTTLSFTMHDARSPSVLSNTEFSNDAGATWATSLNIGDLSPGQVSGEILVRHIIGAAPQMGPYQGTIRMSCSLPPEPTP